VATAILGLVVGGIVAWQLVEPDQPSSIPPSVSNRVGGWPPVGESRTVTLIHPDGSMDVSHWISSERPLDQIILTLPPESTDAAAPDVEASRVAVSADARRAAGPESISRDRASYFFPVEATHLRVRYRLTGAVQRSTSAEGRGLATATTLEVSTTPRRETRVVRSLAVLSLACTQPDEPTRAPVPCGEPNSNSQWTVDLEGADVGARVLASITLS